AIYRRFRECGRLAPEGLAYVSSWVDEKLERCFQLMETHDRKLLDQWIANWSDLTDFEVYPVISSKEAADRITPLLCLACIRDSHLRCNLIACLMSSSPAGRVRARRRSWLSLPAWATQPWKNPPAPSSQNASRTVPVVDQMLLRSHKRSCVET